MPSELLNLILGATSIVTTITVVITLGIIAWQTKESAKQTKLNTIINYHQYIQEVDLALLQHPKYTASLLQESEEDELATLILGVLSLTYELHKENLTNEAVWKSDQSLIYHYMKYEFMRRRWEQTKHIYRHELVQFLDEKLQEIGRREQAPVLPSRSQGSEDAR